MVTLMNDFIQQTIDTVKDALTELGYWNTNFLTTHLPLNIINRAMAIPTLKGNRWIEFHRVERH
jgi:hypothetical protein